MADSDSAKPDVEKTYSETEIQEKLATLPNWEYKDGWIRRKFKTLGWPQTLMLVNAIGYRAEAAFHHPDLLVSWALVVVKLMTHSAKGITDKDFLLAQEIESIATWLPEEGGPLDGFEKGMKKKWVR
jgi:4a-hydroxytetrahydrobiopterin dehydratase